MKQLGYASYGRKQKANRSAVTMALRNAVTVSSSVSSEAHRKDAKKMHRTGGETKSDLDLSPST
jgi:hypothetical protein